MQLLLVSLLLAKHVVSIDYGTTFYVSTTGSDSNNGSETAPFRTLRKARDVIRNYRHTGARQLPPGGVEIIIRGGTYVQTNYSLYNETLLDLSSHDDSGSAESPITWTCYEKEECLLVGGYPIDSSAFAESSANTNWLVADLKKLNSDLWSNMDFGTIASGVLGQCVNTRSELFVNGKRMILARWPNIYYAQQYQGISIWNWTNIVSVQSANSFTYDIPSDKATLWAKQISTASDANGVWLHGYWARDWADSYVKVQSINTSSKLITTFADTPPVYEYKENARYYAVNVLTELDTINEYYVDKSNGLLYISKLRQKTLSSDKYYISTNPYVIKVAGDTTSHTRHDFWNSQRYLQSFVIPPSTSKSEISYQWQPPTSVVPSQALGIEFVTISNLKILYAVNYKHPPWSEQFPYLPNVFNEQPCVPMYDHITDNTFCCGGVKDCTFMDQSNSTCQSWSSTCNHNQQVQWSSEWC
eukprot:190521_1